MTTELPRAIFTSMRRAARAGRAVVPAAAPIADIQWLRGIFDTVVTFGGPQFSEGVRSVGSVAEALSEDAIVWLDASPGLLPEIAACAGRPLAIGNAARFLAPPPAPESLEDWPALTDVLDAARFASPRRYLAVHQGALLSVPGAQAVALATAIRDDMARPEGDPWVRVRRAGASLGDLSRGAFRLALRSLRRR
ncbi:MAG: hypothetical protein AAFX94_04535 [Myxococcota bacterium]